MRLSSDLGDVPLNNIGSLSPYYIFFFIIRNSDALLYDLHIAQSQQRIKAFACG